MTIKGAHALQRTEVFLPHDKSRTPSFSALPLKVLPKQSFPMLYKVFIFPQQQCQSVLLPSHVFVQEQMRVGEDACVKQSGFAAVEEVLIAPQKG